MPRFRLLAVGTHDPYHTAISDATEAALRQMGEAHGFSVDTTLDPVAITEEKLAGYDVFVMNNLAPFALTPEQGTALQAFVEGGKGWVGLHAAGLTGRGFASDKPHWDWFDAFLGGVSYSPHPAYQTGTVVVEDRNHPATRNLPERFEIGDEWYEYDRSPRGGNIRVLATADESTYRPNQPMGDHPVVWTNEAYARTIYLAIGHDPSILANEAYTTLLRDSILWAASR